MSKADDLVKSITPEQLEKTRAEVHGEIESKKDPEAVAVNTTEEDTDEEEPEEQIESQKVDKLDLAMDVQLIMIGKFKYAVVLIWITVGISLLAVAIQILGQSRQLDIQGKMIAVQQTQKEMAEKQKEANDKAKEDAEEKAIAIKEVKEEVKKTKEQVQEAVEASPKLEVDPKSGRTKVVVPVKRPKKGDKKNQEEKDESRPPPPSPPLPTQVELRDEF